MKTILSIEDGGEITIKGKGIKLEVDSDSTTEICKAQSTVNFAKAADKLAEAVEDAENNPLIKFLVNIGGEAMKPKPKPAPTNGKTTVTDTTTTTTTAGNGAAQRVAARKRMRDKNTKK
jgi:hypothetical protein